jgi:hypothetical protein
MQVFIRRTLSVVAIVAIAAASPSAEDYLCENADGCPASITSGGVKRVVVFRKGDLVRTEKGWVVNPSDGWMKVD